MKKLLLSLVFAIALFSCNKQKAVTLTFKYVGVPATKHPVSLITEDSTYEIKFDASNTA